MTPLIGKHTSEQTILAKFITVIKLFFKIIGNDNHDKEEYCEWGPDCNVELVKENCPKYCNK